MKRINLKSLLFSTLLLISCNSFGNDPVKPNDKTIPELREYFAEHGPANPLHNPKAGSYRKWTKTYCEMGLLRGLYCTNRIQNHHFAVTHAQIKVLGPAFAFAYTNEDNLASLCCLTDCPICGKSCHRDDGHGGVFANVNGNFVFLFRSELIRWEVEFEKNKKENGK